MATQDAPLPDGPMSSSDFKAWRKSLNLKQKDAAEVLGLKKRIIQYYEKGKRDGKPVDIPRTVRLACYALTLGVTDFNGETPVPADDIDDEIAEKLARFASNARAKSGTRARSRASTPSNEAQQQAGRATEV